MLFNSLLYPLFLAATVAVYWLVPFAWRRWLLVAYSVFFYAFNEWWFLCLIGGMAGVVWLASQAMERPGERRRWFGVVTLAVVMVLVGFKYGPLFLSSFGYTGHWLMPLGISFFTFEFVHFLVDRYYRRLAHPSLADFLVFALFFPTLASGPIKRFTPFTASLHEARQLVGRYFVFGITLIILGYAQKYLLADNLVERTAFLSDPDLVPSRAALLSALFFYSWRLYFDFAGLSNIAIGSALLFGIIVPLNFNRPFVQADLASFWRNWHMSLTSWIRDYVYMPLVFRWRNQKWVMIGGLVGTMAIIGLWHGASWNYLWFGLYHGLGLAFLQVWRGVRPKLPWHLPKPMVRPLGIALTFMYVMMGWPLFVTVSASDSWALYLRLFGF